jgi:NitT/TauT family transport system substrate-binding protein
MLALLFALTGNVVDAAAPQATVRVGVLRFGTVNWELDVLRHHDFAGHRDIAVEVVPLASKSALTLALQAGEIDLMVGDWLWVAGARQSGERFSFVPYSLAVGSLIVRDPAVRDLRDLRGRRIGVSGGPGDKSWILLRAYARRVIREDLAAVTDQLFAPPPLLGDLIAQGELDAVVTNWNYAVRLRERGLRTLIDVADILPELGIEEPIPLLGWTFDADWAAANESVLLAFLEASYEAKALLASSDTEWARLRPLLGLAAGASLQPLREGYRAGIPQRFGAEQRSAVRRALKVLVDEAGARALGLQSAELPEAMFWPGFTVGTVPATD